MNISRNNYESWFLDYLDGTLNAGQEEKLMSFLDFNPDLKGELEGMERVRLEAETINFQAKETLKKTVDSENSEWITDDFDKLCISGIERQLSQDEENILQNLINRDPEKKNTYELYKSTLLKADKSIAYPKKSILRKRFIDIPGVRITASVAAASAVILLAVSGLFRNPERQGALTGNQEFTESGGSVPEYVEPEATIAERITDEKINPVQEHTQARSTNSQPVHPESAPRQQIKPPAADYQENLAVQFTDLNPPLKKLKPIEAELLSLGENIENRVMAYQLHDKSRSNAIVPIQGSPEERKLNLWKLADASLARINEISEEDYSLEREVDEQGLTRRLTFESPIFGISTPLGSSSPQR